MIKTDRQSIAIEQSLINLVDTELKIMHSLTEYGCPPDMNTTVAMRMSRAIVASICRLCDPDSKQLVSHSMKTRLQDASDSLNSISEEFEQQLLTRTDAATLRQIWFS